MAVRSVPIRVIPLLIVAVVGSLAATVGASRASAHSPCYAHAAAQGCYFQNYRTMLCTAYLHQAPNRSDGASHGLAIGRWKNYDLYMYGEYVIASDGCGGPSTSKWHLSNNGWVSDTVSVAG